MIDVTLYNEYIFQIQKKTLKKNKVSNLFHKIR